MRSSSFRSAISGIRSEPADWIASARRWRDAGGLAAAAQRMSEVHRAIRERCAQVRFEARSQGSDLNLPIGSRLRAGGVTLEVSPLPHNGCQKFIARFGSDALKFVSKRDLRDQI